MNKKKPFNEPVLGDGIDLTARGANFPLMPLMGGGSAPPGLDFPFPGSGADGRMDFPGTGDGGLPTDTTGGD